MDTLEELKQATQIIETMREKRVELMQQARDEGLPITAIAEAAGTARTEVYRLTEKKA